MAADALVAFSGAYCPFVHCGDDSPRLKPWSKVNRRLSHYLLVTSFDGAEDITVEGQTYHVPVGGAYLIQPGWLADLRSQGSRPAWIHFDVRYDPRRLEHPFSGAYESDLGARVDFLQPTSEAVWGVSLPLVIPPPCGRAVRKMCRGSSPAGAVATLWLGLRRPSALMGCC